MTTRYMKTIDDCRKDASMWLVIEGDWGGTVYLSCPAPRIGATQEEIEALAEWLERQVWACNFDEDGEAGHHAFFQESMVGGGISGGMGGGRCTDGLWLHDELGEDFRAVIAEKLKVMA